MAGAGVDEPLHCARDVIGCAEDDVTAHKTMIEKAKVKLSTLTVPTMVA